MANASVKPGKFVVPQNYVVEEVDDNAEPWLEDLEDDDVEIWIMQAPPSVDLSKIQGMPIKLNGKTNFECAGFLGDKLESSVIPSDADKGLQCSLIAPSREDKKFHVVKKPFAGHILLTESFEIPSCIVPDETKFNRSDYPEKLKQNQQFGSYFVPETEQLSSPKKKKSRSDKKKSPKTLEKVVFSSSDEIGLDLENNNGSSNNENHEPDESCSKSVDGLEGSAIMTSADNTLELSASSFGKEKHKKKKKKKDFISPERIVKQEPVELDVFDSTDFGSNTFHDPQVYESNEISIKKKKKKKDLCLPIQEVKQEPLEPDVFDSSGFGSDAIHNQSMSELNEAPEESSERKKKKKKSRHTEEFPERTKSFNNTVTSSIENSEPELSFCSPKTNKKSKNNFVEIKQEPMSPVLNRFSSSQVDDSPLKRKKKKKKDHSIEDSDGSEADRRNESEFTQSSTDMHSSILEYNNMDADDSPAADLVKSKKKKKKIKEEPLSPDLSKTYNGDGSIYEAVTFPVKQEEFDPSYESFSKSTSSSSKSRKSKDRRSTNSHSSQEVEEIKQDIETLPSVFVKGKDFSVDEEFLKALKSRKKEKHKKKSVCVKEEPLSP